MPFNSIAEKLAHIESMALPLSLNSGGKPDILEELADRYRVNHLHA